MPYKEEGIEMDRLGSVYVYDGVVHVSVRSSWVQGLVELRRLGSKALNGVCVCLSLLWSHCAEILSDFDSLVIAGLWVFAGAFVLKVLLDDWVMWCLVTTDVNV